MTFTTFVSGVNTNLSDELNSNFLANKVAEVYTGSGFDCSQTSSGTNTNNTTLTLTAGELDNATYLLIYVTYRTAISNVGDSETAELTLAIDRAESGGGFSSFLGATAVGRVQNAGTYCANMATAMFVLTLTSGEKASGIDLKLTGASTVSGTITACSLNNISTLLMRSY